MQSNDLQKTNIDFGRCGLAWLLRKHICSGSDTNPAWHAHARADTVTSANVDASANVDTFGNADSWRNVYARGNTDADTWGDSSVDVNARRNRHANPHTGINPNATSFHSNRRFR